jgi:hypothetical protein
MLRLQQALEELSKDNSFYGEIGFKAPYIFSIKFHYDPSVDFNGVTSDDSYFHCVKVEVKGVGFTLTSSTGEERYLSFSEGVLVFD